MSQQPAMSPSNPAQPTPHMELQGARMWEGGGVTSAWISADRSPSSTTSLGRLTFCDKWDKRLGSQRQWVPSRNAPKKKLYRCRPGIFLRPTNQPRGGGDLGDATFENTCLRLGRAQTIILKKALILSSKLPDGILCVIVSQDPQKKNAQRLFSHLGTLLILKLCSMLPPPKTKCQKIEGQFGNKRGKYFWNAVKRHFPAALDNLWEGKHKKKSSKRQKFCKIRKSKGKLQKAVRHLFSKNLSPGF